jgi:hypothetical protein
MVDFPERANTINTIKTLFEQLFSEKLKRLPFRTLSDAVNLEAKVTSFC